MAVKKQASQVSISNCHIENTTAPANEHTRDAIVALAKAAEANAVAIQECAKALKGGNATMDAGIRISPDEVPK